MQNLQLAPYLAALLLAHSAQAATFITPPDQSYLEPVFERFSNDIVKRCGFENSLPITVVSDSEAMISLLHRNNLEGFQQYLFTRKSYSTEVGINPGHNMRLCGLHDWLIEKATLFGEYFQQELSSYEGSGSGSNATAPGNATCEKASVLGSLQEEIEYDACENDSTRKERTEIILSKNHPASSIILTNSDVEIRHLRLSVKNLPPDINLQFAYNSLGAHLTLEHSELEDVTGRLSNFLYMQINSTLTINQSLLTFKSTSMNSGGAAIFSSAALLQINQLEIIHKDKKGRSIQLYGSPRSIDSPYFIKNTRLRAPDNSSLIAMVLYDGRPESPLQINNLTIEGGFSQGFVFDYTPTPTQFYLSPEGNSGIIWNSTVENATRCSGENFSGTLSFSDGYICTGSLGLTTSLGTTSSTTSIKPTTSSSQTPSGSSTTDLPVSTSLPRPEPTLEATSPPNLPVDSGVNQLLPAAVVVIASLLSAMLVAL